MKESKIIIVEDDPDHADIILDVFETEGVKSEVVLMKDGISVLRFLKNDSRFSTIPVVILSTSADQDTISKAYKNGANKYIVKPISFEEFVGRIESLKSYWTNTNTLIKEN